MEVIPLKRNLYDRAKALGLTEITLNFQGGSDEGYLDVQINHDHNHAAVELFAELASPVNWTMREEAKDSNSPQWQSYQEWKDACRVLLKDLESWAWSVYDYSGAGGGHDYGDDITYNLDYGSAEWQEWFMERTEGGSRIDENMIDTDPVEPEPVAAEPKLRGGQLPKEDA